LLISNAPVDVNEESDEADKTVNEPVVAVDAPIVVPLIEPPAIVALLTIALV
jgi:hypothetical protein